MIIGLNVQSHILAYKSTFKPSQNNSKLGCTWSRAHRPARLFTQKTSSFPSSSFAAASSGEDNENLTPSSEASLPPAEAVETNAASPPTTPDTATSSSVSPPQSQVTWRALLSNAATQEIGRAHV